MRSIWSNFRILCNKFLHPTNLYLHILLPIFKILPRQSRISNSRSSSRLKQVCHEQAMVRSLFTLFSTKTWSLFVTYMILHLQIMISWSPFLEWSLAKQWALKTDLTPAQPTPLSICFKFIFGIMNKSFNPYCTPCLI
jgi:hypothetical protein